MVLSDFCTSYSLVVAMMASGFSWPSTTLVCSAEYSSLKLIGVGDAPSAWNKEVRIGAGGTRSLNPLRSPGVRTSRVEDVTWRKPLSQNGVTDTRPALAICAAT